MSEREHSCRMMPPLRITLFPTNEFPLITKPPQKVPLVERVPELTPEKRLSAPLLTIPLLNSNSLLAMIVSALGSWNSSSITIGPLVPPL